MAHPEPNFDEALQVHNETKMTYVNSYIAASAIGISNKVFNRITGTVLVVTGEKRFPVPDSANKVNVGLQLKFPKNNEEVVDYTRYDNRQWLYSRKAIEVVEAYYMKYPKVFELLNKGQGMNDFIFESELNTEQPVNLITLFCCCECLMLKCSFIPV